MKFIGNYKDWLKPEWIEYVLTHTGKEMPRYEYQKNNIQADIETGERAECCPLHQKYESAGYSHDSLLYYIFEQDDLPFKIDLPNFIELKENQGAYWNLFKYNPGNILPVHSDRSPKWEKNCDRYWMSWLDWEVGHVFVYDDYMVSNYKAGDLYKFTDPFGVHGAANIGLSPRITFQITTYDKE